LEPSRCLIESSLWSCSLHCRGTCRFFQFLTGAVLQLAQTKSADIEGLLQRLSDINDEMGSAIGGASDSRSHTLARHRDILQEFSQVGSLSTSLVL
jgi:hypothetical protein